MADILTGRAFDCITVNWVLHHLVGKSYRTCWQNCLATLVCCKGLLKPNGVLIVAENMFDGYLRTNLPSHLIYRITSMRWPWFVGLARRFFNTAGTGVCFRSQRAWQQLFAQAGFEVVAFQRGRVWWRGSFRGMLIPLLFLKSASNDHFFLKIADNREIYYTQGQEST